MKKGMLKTAIAVALIVLIMSGLIAFASGTDPVYLMSVNDKVVPVTPENMPLYSRNEIYIPHTMLSSEITGVDLGVRAQYRVSRSALMVTDGQQIVTFDLRRNTAHDAWGTELNAVVLVRNSMVFVPLSWLCSFFDQLSYSLSYTPYGTLVRLTNAEVVLSDEMFIDAADQQLSRNLQNYLNALKPSPTATTSPNPSPSPVPTPSVKPPELAADVYLAFRWGSHISEAADLLEEHDQRGLFLFTHKELMQEDDLVRRLVATGHQVGLMLEGADLEHCLSELEYGREIMKNICRSMMLIVAADELPEEAIELLEQEPCAVWRADVGAVDTSWSTLSRKLKSEKNNYVDIVCNQEGMEFLKTALRYLEGEEYDLHQVLAPLI